MLKKDKIGKTKEYLLQNKVLIYYESKKLVVVVVVVFQVPSGGPEFTGGNPFLMEGRKNYKGSQLFHRRDAQNCVKSNSSTRGMLKTSWDSNNCTGRMLETTQVANYSTREMLETTLDVSSSTLAGNYFGC